MEKTNESKMTNSELKELLSEIERMANNEIIKKEDIEGFIGQFKAKPLPNGDVFDMTHSGDKQDDGKWPDDLWAESYAARKLRESATAAADIDVDPLDLDF